MTFDLDQKVRAVVYNWMLEPSQLFSKSTQPKTSHVTQVLPFDIGDESTISLAFKEQRNLSETIGQRMEYNASKTSPVTESKTQIKIKKHVQRFEFWFRKFLLAFELNDVSIQGHLQIPCLEICAGHSCHLDVKFVRRLFRQWARCEELQRARAGQLTRLPKFIIINCLPISVGTRLKRQTHRIWFAGVRVEDRDSEERLHNTWPPPITPYYEPEEDQSNQIYQPHGSQASRPQLTCLSKIINPQHITALSNIRLKRGPRFISRRQCRAAPTEKKVICASSLRSIGCTRPTRRTVLLRASGDAEHVGACSRRLFAPTPLSLLLFPRLTSTSEYSPRRVTGSLARPRGHPRITTGLYHTSQWGTARIPYRGAVVKVPVVGESRKRAPCSSHPTAPAYAGVDGRNHERNTLSCHSDTIQRNSVQIVDIKATSTDNQQQFHPNRLHNTLVNGKVRFSNTVNVAGYAVQDASVEDQVCVRCPVDRTVVASRGTDFVFMPHSKLKKCKHRPRVPGAKWEYLYGPRPGSIITEGSHVVAGRALYNHKQLQQCQYRYTVLGMNTFSSCLQYYRYRVLGMNTFSSCLQYYRYTVLGMNTFSSCLQYYRYIVLGMNTFSSCLQYYRYIVLVRKCPPLMLPKYVDAHCSRGNVWGSECELLCHQGYQLHGHNVTVCGDQLLWSNSLPQCSVMTDCPLPMSPSHGRLSCHTPDGSVSSNLLPEGSVCRYMCDEGYSVPESESHLLITLNPKWANIKEMLCITQYVYDTELTPTL
uniref:Sushi domain-containing protein n=1 Tax=Timema genevievae TaxID=629358 RepID=A0A7R9JML9_TIMGE|nr:unnamed protein product [Timema genevievae]